MFSRAKILLALMVMLMACSLSTPQPLPTDAPTPTELTGPTAAPIVVTVTPPPQITATAANCGETTSAAIRYDLATTLNVEAHTAEAVLKASYRNETGQPLSDVVLNVEPNRRPDAFKLIRLESDIPVQQYTLVGPRLEVLLKPPLQPGCQVTLTLAFSVQPGLIAQSYIGNNGYFGYSERQMNLAEWLPEFAIRKNGEWITPKPWPLGEFTAANSADYTADVKVTGKDAEKILVVGPGQVVDVEPQHWRFTLTAARSFALSASAIFDRLDAASADDVGIELYYFRPENSPIPAAAKHALEMTRIALNRFSDLYGPLSNKRMVVVEGDFPDGMEFSGLVFVSQSWFATYKSTPDSLLTLITVHEISHQWWYSLVGSDQATDPFLDESLALYSELLFIQGQYPNLVQWWWTFRVKTYAPVGFVDSTIYDFQNLRLYINAVYLRGALMLQEIRDALGDEAFFRWLRNYRDAEAGKIATPADLWQSMTTSDYVKIGAIRAKYLRQSDPLHLMLSTTEPCCG